MISLISLLCSSEYLRVQSTMEMHKSDKMSTTAGGLLSPAERLLYAIRHVQLQAGNH